MRYLITLMILIFLSNLTLGQQTANKKSDCLSLVYPGDINNDGIVNEQDLAHAELNLYTLGSARVEEHQNIDWYPHPAQDWGLMQFNGQDLKHADCNGDGLIDQNDKQAVIQNMGETSTCDDICIANTPCDDNNGCTINDVYDNDCNCEGVFVDGGREAVYPGDLNHDGIVNIQDLGLSGLYLYEVGSPRGVQHQNSEWYPHPAQDWGRQQLNNEDIKHFDCNGDGAITPSDHLIVEANLGKIYSCDYDCTANSPCDDFNECTVNDNYDVNCNCEGTFVDADSDGICDVYDICPNGDDNIDDNNNSIPDDCENNCIANTPCDDNNGCTINDVYDNDCNCEGVSADGGWDAVYPGDLNHDGIVNIQDLGLLGLYLYEVGPPRAVQHQNSVWYPHPAQDWGRQHLNNEDIKHFDCNGDGAITPSDRLIVEANLGKIWQCIPEAGNSCCTAFLHWPDNRCINTPSTTSTSLDVISGQAIEVNAVNSICLLPGFEADAIDDDNLFLAHINNCFSGIPKKANIAIENTINITNYPNPFNSKTEIEYTINENTTVTLFISDVSGRKISTLIEKEMKSIGSNKVVFDGINLPAGIYYCTIQAGDHLETQKMVLTK